MQVWETRRMERWLRRLSKMQFLVDTVCADTNVEEKDIESTMKQVRSSVHGTGKELQSFKATEHSRTSISQRRSHNDYKPQSLEHTNGKSKDAIHVVFHRIEKRDRMANARVSVLLPE